MSGSVPRCFFVLCHVCVTRLLDIREIICMHPSQPLTHSVSCQHGVSLLGALSEPWRARIPSCDPSLPLLLGCCFAHVQVLLCGLSEGGLCHAQVGVQWSMDTCSVIVLRLVVAQPWRILL